MKLVRWILGAILLAVAVVALLDTFGGYFLDGPLGPIPGGRLESGEIVADPSPDWAAMDVEKVVELEIRPQRPWSLSVWNAVVDGELYVPSRAGARRRWPPAALADPRVRVRTGGKIYERRIVKLTDPEMRRRVAAAFAERYDLGEPPDPAEDTTWYFHLAPRDGGEEGARR